MNVIVKIILATMAGVEVVFSFITPILISLMWVELFSFELWGSYVIYGAGLLTAFFRAIKIGWLKK